MIDTDQSSPVALPASLQGQFAGLERRLWQTETLAWSCFGAISLVLSYLALYLADRLWETPVWFRSVCLLGGLGGLAWFAFRWFRHWVMQRRDQRALAMLVQKEYRRLGDRLLGIVELAEEHRRPAGFSPALYRAAIEQVAGEASQFDFTKAVGGESARASVRALIGAAFVLVAIIVLSPAAAANVFGRWIAPGSPTPRFTLVQLVGLPREQVVPHGEPFEIRCGVEYRSWWRPARAVGQVEQQLRIPARREGSALRWRVPAQVQPGILTLRLGDARQRVRIQPLHRPSLRELHASVQLPAYLQYPAVEQDVENGVLNVVEGSIARLNGKASRPLASAELRVSGGEGEALPTQADGFSAGPLKLEDVAELTFRWRDTNGLESAGPWRLRVQAEKDSPASPELRELQKDTAILHTETLDLKVAGRDDFGVRDVGLEWQLIAGEGPTNSPSSRRLTLAAKGPQEKVLQETFPFSPEVFGIAPDSIVELRGLATDFFPGREASATPLFRIHILGTERHAELVRQNLESLLAQLEEVTRLEEKLAATTREAQQLSDDKLAAPEAGERLAEAKQEQEQNAAQLQELSQEGAKTLREAFRNPTFTEDTLREWAKNLREMQQLSQQQMSQAAKALQSAQQKPGERRENVDEAARKEQEALDALEDLQRNVNKGLDQLQALTLAERLRKSASDEKRIAAGLQRIIPDIIGMLPRDLPPRARQIEAGLATDQETVQKGTTELHAEIGRFFERTQKPAYGQVHKEMKDEQVPDELDRIRGLILDNISMDASQTLVSWAERLIAWANLLEPKSDSSGSGGEGGGGGEGNEALLKELLGLLRVRDREVNLRQRTAQLDRQQTGHPDYGAAAKGLAATQEKVRETLSTIQGENPVPALEFPLQDIVDQMQSVGQLLEKPQTDRETLQAQTQAIELLSDIINLINEQQQRNNSSSSSQSASAEEMAFLMEMMAQQNNPAPGMALNPNGGGNTAGGTTDRTSAPMLGDPTGKQGESRAAKRAAGRSAPVPTEFRDALEKYFRAVEQLEAK